MAASTSGILNPDSRDKAAIFLNPLEMRMGTVASIGYPAESDKPAMFLTPSWILSKREAGLKLIIYSGRIAPSSYTEHNFKPYSNGLRFSFFNKAAYEALIFFPLLQTLKSLVI